MKYGTTMRARPDTANTSSTAATNYVDSGNTVVWNATTANLHTNRIAFIGQDDASAWRKTASAIIAPAGTEILKISNPSDLEDREFASVADDNAQITNAVSSNSPQGFASRLARTWKWQTVGGDGVGSVNLAFDLTTQTAIPNNGAPATYKLMIDTDGDFTSGAIISNITPTVSAGVVTFAGVPQAQLTNGAQIAIGQPGAVLTYSNATWNEAAANDGTIDTTTPTTITLTGGGSTTEAGVNWTARTPASSNQWQSIAYGNGLFVAVANTGTGNRVMTSPDGITWTARTSAADNNWTSVTYGAGLFVAVANSGTGNRVMTSPDGITWTSRTSAADNNWRSVTYGGGQFIAVATSGVGNRIMTSPDGITWTIGFSAADNAWQSITYGNGLFVAVSNTGSGDRIMTSSNGINWFARTNPVNNNWASVTYGNGIFVAVANDGILASVMTSSNGTSWSIQNASVANAWQGVTFGRGVFVAIASSDKFDIGLLLNFSSTLIGILGDTNALTFKHSLGLLKISLSTSKVVFGCLAKAVK
jgi:hypothetical protein